MWNFQNLYRILRGDCSVSADVFGAILESNATQLAAVLETPKFSKQNLPNEKTTLESDGRLLPEGKNLYKLLEILAETLNVNLRTAYDVFSSFLLTNYVWSENLEKSCGEERLRNQLIVEITNFYRTEQLYLIRCLCEILKSLQGDDSPVVAKLYEFVNNRLSALVPTVLAQLEAVINGDLLPISSLKNLKNAAQLSAWAAHGINLQIGLVELLLWHFHLLQHSADELVTCISTLKDHNFGLKQPLRRFNQDGVELGMLSLVRLNVVLVMRTFDVDWFLAQYLHTSSDENHTQEHEWLGKGALEKLAAVLEQMTGNREHLSAVYLAWAMMEQLILTMKPEQTDEKAEKIRKLGCLAHEYDAVSQLLDILVDPILVENDDLRKLTATIVYSIVDAFLCFFEPDSLSSQYDLDRLLGSILSEQPLAEDFWSRDFSSGVAQYVRERLYTFPMYFDGCLQLLSSLCRASQASCHKVVAMFQRLPCYSEDATLVSAAELGDAGTDADSIFRLVTDRWPYGTGPNAVVIRAGTVGQVIVSAEDNMRFVQWRSFFNGWQVCLLEVEKLSNNPSSSDFANVLSVFKLLDAALKSDAQLAEKFVHFLNCALQILSSFAMDSVETLDLPIACLKCIAAAAKSHSVEILNQLSGADILPSFTSLDVSLGERKLRPGLVGAVLKDEETRLGEYGVTLGFVSLLENCLHEEQCFEHPAFVASLVFVLRRIFPFYQKWKYMQSSVKDEIGSRVLSIVHWVLQRPNNKPLPVAVESCRHELISGDARSSLIGLVSVGPAVLKHITQNSAGENEERAIKLILRALSVLSQLLDVESEQAEVGLIFQEMRSLVADQQCDQPVAALAKYLLYNSDSRLPKLALVCLRKFSLLFPVSVLSCLGDWANALCQVFVERLQSTLEDVQLKVYCLDFVAVCVQSQPALAERLFGTPATEGNQMTGALASLFEIISSEEQVPQLLLSAYRLLVALWKRRHRTAIERLTSNERFWPTVCAPLLAAENNYYLRIVALALEVVAHEVYWCHTQSQTLPSKLATIFADAKLLESDRLKLFYRKLTDLLPSQMERKHKLELLLSVRHFVGVLGCEAGDKLRPNAESRELWTMLHLKLFALLSNKWTDVLEDQFALLRCFGQIIATQPTSWYQNITDWEPISDHLLQSAKILAAKLPLHLVPAAVELLGPLFMVVLSKNGQTAMLPSYLDCCLDLLEKQFVLHFNSSLATDSTAVKPLITSTNLSVCLVEKLLRILEPEQWLQKVRRRTLLRSLVALMEKQRAQGQFNSKFCIISCSLVSHVIAQEKLFDLMMSCGYLELCCVQLSTQLYPCNSPEKQQLLCRVLSAFTNGLDGLGHGFLSHALDFVGSYAAIICQSLDSAVEPGADEWCLAAGHKCLEFVLSLSKYNHKWKFELPAAFEQLTSCVSGCCLSLINSLSKPHLLQNILRRSRSMSEVSNESASADTSSSSNFDPATAAAHKQMLELLQLSLLFLRSFAPDLAKVADDETFDAQSYELLLDLEMSTTVSSKDKRLSFGSLLLCIQLCISALRKVESVARTASPAAHRHAINLLAMSDRTVLTAVLECAVDLVLSETALYLRHPCVSARDQSALRREVITELAQLLMRCFRYAGGSPSRPGTPRRSQSPQVSPFDQTFIKFAYDFIQDLSHTN